MILLWSAAWLGAAVRSRRPLDEDIRQDYSVVQGAVLTLAALIIGFSFSMAVGRYDQRKVYEEEEANAIGTEYLRAGLLPAADASQVRVLLAGYLDQRILFFTTRDDQQLRQVGERTAKSQSELWLAVQAPGTAQPSALVALAVGGMNDVLNSQGYTLAAWRNRIPPAAWALMAAIAIFSSAMVGYGAKALKAKSVFLGVLPLVVSISFFLIADIDSPRAGLIRVTPENLISLAGSIRPTSGAVPSPP
jgi:hypothetical protein